MKRTLLAGAAALCLCLSAGAALAQAGSGASAPVTPDADSRITTAPRSPALGDPGPARARTRPVARVRRRAPVAAGTENGTTVARAAGAAGGR